MLHVKTFESEYISRNKTIKETKGIFKRTEVIKHVTKFELETLDEVMQRVTQWLNHRRITDFKFSITTKNTKAAYYRGDSQFPDSYNYKTEEYYITVIYKMPEKDLINL
jgi:hypothetical protein